MPSPSPLPEAVFSVDQTLLDSFLPIQGFARGQVQRSDSSNACSSSDLTELAWYLIFESVCVRIFVSMYVHVCTRAKSLQLCQTLCDPVDCSPPGFSVHAILQVRILEWVAVSSSRGSSQPRDQTRISMSPALPGRFFTTSATWEAHVFVCVCVCVFISLCYTPETNTIL